MPEFACSYDFDGKQWSITVHADTHEEAEMKLRAIGQSGKVDGVLDEIIPAVGGSVSFVGRVSGDCECFCWDDVPKEDHKRIVPDAWQGEGRLYPNDILWYLGCTDDKRYRFTVSTEEIK